MAGGGWSPVGRSVKFGVELIGELVDGFLEQFESTIQVLAAAVLVAVGVGDDPGAGPSGRPVVN